MIRKLLVLVAAIAMPVSMVAVTGSVASAKTPPVNATNYTVSCTGLTGSAKFSPALMLTSGSSSETVAVKATLSGCTATPTAGGTAVAIGKASAKGTIHSDASQGCEGLVGSMTDSGSFSVKWKATPKLTAATSTIGVGTVTGGTDSNGYPQFVLTNPPSVSGPFQGTNSGASDSTRADTTSTEAQVLTACQGKKGLKKLGLDSPASGAAVSLG